MKWATRPPGDLPCKDSTYTAAIYTDSHWIVHLGGAGATCSVLEWMFTVYGLDGVGIWFTADVPETVLALHNAHKPRYITASCLMSIEGSSSADKGHKVGWEGAVVRELMNFYLNLFSNVCIKSCSTRWSLTRKIVRRSYSKPVALLNR